MSRRLGSAASAAPSLVGGTSNIPQRAKEEDAAVTTPATPEAMYCATLIAEAIQEITVGLSPGIDLEVLTLARAFIDECIQEIQDGSSDRGMPNE